MNNYQETKDAIRAEWDPNFHDFMTIRELFHYPIRHFNFHMEQIAR